MALRCDVWRVLLGVPDSTHDPPRGKNTPGTSPVKSVMPRCSEVRAGQSRVTLIPNTWLLRRRLMLRMMHRAFYFQGHFNLRRWGFTHRLVLGAELLLLVLLRDGLGGDAADR